MNGIAGVLTPDVVNMQFSNSSHFEGNLLEKLCKTKTSRSKFATRNIIVWNALPYNIKNASNIVSFKLLLSKFYKH